MYRLSWEEQAILAVERCRMDDSLAPTLQGTPSSPQHTSSSLFFATPNKEVIPAVVLNSNRERGPDHENIEGKVDSDEGLGSSPNDDEALLLSPTLPRPLSRRLILSRALAVLGALVVLGTAIAVR